MAQNQKYMKLGPSKGAPTKQTLRRLHKRGGSWLARFRVEHEEKKVRSAARTHLRRLEEVKKLKKEQEHDCRGESNA